MKNAIKITKENPFLHDKDAKTLDVEFPLYIAENRMVFGPIHRVDTSKKRDAFTDCRLIVDNIPVISGTGRVSEVTQDCVKLQILSGNNSVRYRSEFDRIFIDRIQYPAVASKYRSHNDESQQYADLLIVTDEIQSKRYVGDITKYIFMPVVDATNESIANEMIAVMRGYSKGDTEDIAMVHTAVQPNLMMVLRTVIDRLGYTIIENVYDVSPWNELFICSVRMTTVIANALPHWTAATFLDEFRKLFNASYLFDEEAKTVRIVQSSSLNDMSTVEYEVSEEITSTYDEDGIEYLGSSNIKYNLSGMGSETEAIPEDVFKEFETAEFGTVNELITAFNNLPVKDKLTKLFIDPNGYIYGYEQEDGEGNKTGAIGMKRTGVFSPLVRNSESDTYAELNICPVAMEEAERELRYVARKKQLVHVVLDILNYHTFSTRHKFMLPVMENNYGNGYSDEEERGYVSVQDVIESGEKAKAEEEEEDYTMQLLWPALQTFVPYDDPSDGDHMFEIPLSHTDMVLCHTSRYCSLALSHASNRTYIGRFHERVIRINAGSSVDANNEVCIKFTCDGIPDVNKIFVFHGKAYLCSKVDIEVSDNGIDPMKTGYFYEML